MSQVPVTIFNSLSSSKKNDFITEIYTKTLYHKTNSEFYEIIPYFSNDNIKYFNETYLKYIPIHVFSHMMGHENYKNYIQQQLTRIPRTINVCEHKITNLSTILLKSRRFILENNEKEYIFDLISNAKKYTPEMINLLLELCLDELTPLEESTIFELLEFCCQNVKNFSTSDIKPTSGAIPYIYMDELYIDFLGNLQDTSECYPLLCHAIEIVITFTGIHIDEAAIDHIKACGISITEPERFLDSKLTVNKPFREC